MNEANLPNMTLKVAKSQLLQAEVEAFLAKGGKIKQLDSHNRAVKTNPTTGLGRFASRKANASLRDFLALNLLNAQKLASLTGVSEERLRDYAQGHLELSVHDYVARFQKHISRIKTGGYMETE